MKNNALTSPFAFAAMAFQGTMLAIEAQQVIAMRLTKMALGGPGVQREAALMVTEKLETMTHGSRLMLRGALDGKSDLNADKVVALYRRKVTANKRRLSK